MNLDPFHITGKIDSEVGRLLFALTSQRGRRPVLSDSGVESAE